MTRPLGFGLNVLWQPSATVLTPTMAAYADVPASLTTTGTGVRTQVTGWGPLTTRSGTPLLNTDTVNGGQMVRTAPGDVLYAPASSASFLSTGASTIFVVWRYRRGVQGALYPFIDTTELGTKRGYQLQVCDSSSIFAHTFGVRIWNGSSWVVDTPSNQETFGTWIPQKIHVAAFRLTSTGVQMWVDGQFVWVSPQTLSFAFPAADVGRLAVGGGPYDIFAWELFNSPITDSTVASHIRTLASRFGVDLIYTLAGDPTFLAGGAHPNAAFPCAAKLPTGHIQCNSYDDNDNETATDTNHAYVSNDLSGTAFATPSLLTQNINTLRWSDIKQSEQLSDGSILQCTNTFDQNNNVLHVQVRRSTDGGNTYGSWLDVFTGNPVNMAVESSPVEDPNNAGHVYIPVYTVESPGDTKRSISMLVSTDYGQTWPTRTTIRSGPTDGKDYAEPGLLFRSDGLYCMVRDDTVPANTPMLQTHSATAPYTSWSTPVTGPTAWSAGKGVKALGDGMEVWAGRTFGGFGNTCLFWRPAGSAWNAAWNTYPTAPLVDPCQGFNYYADIIPTPGNTFWLVFGRNANNTTQTNIAYRPNMQSWLPRLQMPGHVTPSTVTVDGNVSSTYQIQAFGSGDFTYTITTHGSSGSAVSGTGLYSMGGNGVDVITVTDAQGFTVGTVTITVVNGVWTPANLGSQLAVWHRGDSNLTLSGSNVTQWGDKSGNGCNLTPDASQFNPTSTTNINSQGTVSFVSSERMIYAGTAPTLTSACHVFVVKKNADDGVTAMAAYSYSSQSGQANEQPYTNRQVYDDTGSTTRQATGWAPATGAWASAHIFEVIGTSSEWTLKFNGTQVYTQGSNTFGAATKHVGGGTTNSQYFTGDIAEIIVCNQKLSSGDEASVIAYLKARYNIP